MPALVHFEIHAADPERAMQFYRAVFGWTFNRWGEQPYWLIDTGRVGGPGIDGGLVPRRGPTPADGQAVNAFVCTVAVDAVDAVLVQSTAAGGSTAVPKMPVPGVGWLAYLKDTEGNLVGVMQNDPAAR
jgi:predicted enzyme related to lactoylglutathione lyase